MHKLTLVEKAKTLFEEAKDWGVWRWLTEKRKARETADAAWAALEAYEKDVRAAWSDALERAYHELEVVASTNGDGRSRRARERAADVDPEIKAAAKLLKEADDQSSQARASAEAQFDEADRQMSTDMACAGAQMAIDAWELREKFIRKAESLGRRLGN